CLNPDSVPLANVDGLSAELAKKQDYGAKAQVGRVWYGVATADYKNTAKEIVIKTGIPFISSNVMPLIHFFGYAYGIQSPIEMYISFYIFGGAFGYGGCTSTCPWKPTVKLFTYLVGSVKYVGVALIGDIYFPRFQVDFQDIWSNSRDYSNNWTVEYNVNTNADSIVPTTDLYTVPYKPIANDISGNAATATALTTNAGTATTPVYFSEGKPVACTYTLAKSVPANAVFTDTVYTHPTTAGNKHIPDGGSSGQILQWSSDGTASWETESSNLSRYPNTDIWRSNLGSPTVQEAAVIPEQMTNKFKFFPIDSISAETSTDGGTTWTATTLTTTQKKNLVCGNPNLTADINIAYTNQFRLIFEANDTISYVFLNMLYIWCSTGGQNLKIKVEGQLDGSTAWATLSAPSNSVNNWPGHCTLWHQYIRYYAGTDTARYCKVRVTFIPVQNGTYTNSITIYNMRWYGGYPSGKVEIFNWDYDKNVTFPGGLSAKSIDATKLSGIIPSACYSNTTYSVATTAANGLMAATDKEKLNSIATNANNYTHPATHPISMVEGLQTALDSRLTQTALESLLTLNSAGQIVAIAGHQIYGAPALVWQSFTLGGLLEVDGGGIKTYTLMANGSDYQSGSYIICSVMRAGSVYGCPVSSANGAKWVILYGTSSKSMVYTGRTGTNCYDCTAWYEDDTGSPATATITKIS
ncbi:MAG: hypothetical protein WCS28_11895, partial [Thiomicrospira sp.]